MKKIIFGLMTILISVTCLTGCLKRDNMENIDIITTIYPIEYVTNRLYGENNHISSIYPRSANIDSYKITSKQISDYSQWDLFIYNGNSKERDYATKMLNTNKDLKIIDASYGLSPTYSDSDIWLNPSNLLMLGQNIKTELEDLIVNDQIIKTIKGNYEQLKVDMTVLETELGTAAQNSVNNTIVSSDESLNFLKKYGFNVINLTNNGKTDNYNIDKAIQLINEGKIDYIFTLEHSTDNSDVESIINNYDVKPLTIRSLATIEEKDIKNNDDYISLMNYNIDLLKKETYK